MNDCARSLDYLLEAELGELDAASDTEIGRHIRDCERCRRAAQKMLDGTARLDAALATVPDGFDVDAVLKRARSPESGPRSSTATALHSQWKRFATLALAASIVGLLVLRNWDEALPGPALVPRVTAELPIVEPSSGQSVAVINTDNPDITVLWFF